MLGEVGVKFGFKGGRDAITMMQRLKGEYGALSSAVDRGAARISRGFSVMSTGIKAGAVAGIAAIGALTAAAVAIPYKLAQSRAELTNEQANLRALGLDDKAIDTFEAAAEAFASKVAGVTKAAYTKASYDVVSAFASVSTEEQAKIADMALITGKATKMSAESATKLFGSLWGAAGDQIKAQGAAPFVEKWSGAVYTAVKELKTTGEELASAAKNSISMLMEAGWKPEEMTAFWGQLITSGLSGEAAGTALKQMALKEQGAFGKMIAKASGKMVDTEFMKGDAKAAAEAWNKGLIEGAGGVGAKLFKTDPVKWLERMGDAFDKIKAQGGDYKKFIAETFGEESANAMMQFFEKRGQMRKTIDTIAKGSYGDVRKIVEEQMSKGIGPASALMGQLWQNLKQSMGKTFEGLFAPAFGWLGGKLLQANALWKSLFSDMNPIDKIAELNRVGGEGLILLYDKLRGLPSNISAFTSGFGAAFAGAFGGLDGVAGRLNEIVNLLGQPDAAKWRQIGEEFGKLAGMSLDGIKAAIRDIAADAKAIGDVMHMGAEGIRWLKGTPDWGDRVKHGMWKEDQAAERPGDKSFMDKAWSYTPWGSAFPRAPWMQHAPNWSPMAGPEETGFPRWQGGRAPTTRRQAGQGGDTPAAAPAAAANVQVEAPKLDVKVQIGPREIKDFIVELFEREKARSRQGAGDGFQMGMF